MVVAPAGVGRPVYESSTYLIGSCVHAVAELGGKVEGGDGCVATVTSGGGLVVTVDVGLTADVTVVSGVVPGVVVDEGAGVVVVFAVGCSTLMRPDGAFKAAIAIAIAAPAAMTTARVALKTTRRRLAGP